MYSEKRLYHQRSAVSFYRLSMRVQHSDQEARRYPYANAPPFPPSFPSALCWESIRLLKKRLCLLTFVYMESNHRKSIGEGQGKDSLSPGLAVGPATQWMTQFTVALWDACTTGLTNRDVPHGIPAWNQPTEFSPFRVRFLFSSSQVELGKHLKWELFAYKVSPSFWILIGVGALSFPSFFRTLLPKYSVVWSPLF